MKQVLTFLILAAIAAPALADDQSAIDACIASWGAQSPFPKGAKPNRVIGAGVKVFGIGERQGNEETTTAPSLVLVNPAVNVAGKSTVRLANPNGWYCLQEQTTVAGKITIQAHCDAHLANAKGDGTAVAAHDDTGKGVAVAGALRVQRFGCKT
ncbi:hypothetical protein DSM104443_04078 [Usitatibacter rugosus]|uniref:Uncharacterized protein n=1 Tax=Usitatibacter rugosus TaxID=2732067 RepID=A0A6M4H355_9PROT|nr:hypothetical protein [Usitatibacter rugosus]QJR12984.1 hypothetical protein DSM104443_04078 [Usitatibacter rugosus]